MIILARYLAFGSNTKRLAIMQLSMKTIRAPLIGGKTTKKGIIRKDDLMGETMAGHTIREVGVVAALGPGNGRLLIGQCHLIGRERMISPLLRPMQARRRFGC